MPHQLSAAWRARRALIIGDRGIQALCMKALLGALGARPALIPPDSPAHALNRAMLSGKISAVIVPDLHLLCREGDLFSKLRALDRLLCEVREAGIPLCILCSDEDVYAQTDGPAQEDTLLGGKTREGLFHAILQLYADGFSRGLLGDAVSLLVCRHPPCLLSAGEDVRQYEAWCRAILQGDAPVVEHPGAQGCFLHPLDMALGVLSLGAAFLMDGEPHTGCFNIAPAQKNLCANRSAYRLLAAGENDARAAKEAYPPRACPHAQLSGAKIKSACGFSPVLDAKDALGFLMAYERALCIGQEAAQQALDEQALAVLSMLP